MTTHTREASEASRHVAGDDLLPCPFCGSAAERAVGKNGDGSPWHYIECTGLGCGAIADPDMWNTRVSDGDRNGEDRDSGLSGEAMPARSAQAETPENPTQDALNRHWENQKRVIAESNGLFDDEADTPKTLLDEFTTEQLANWDERDVKAVVGPPHPPTDKGVESLIERLRTKHNSLVTQSFIMDEAATALERLTRERDEALARAKAAEWGLSQWRCAAAVVSQYGECTPVDLTGWTPVEMSQAIHRIGARAEASEAREASLKAALEIAEPSDEMVTAFMREFGKWTPLLRYKEAEKWHVNDIMGVRHALRAALTTKDASNA